MDMKFIKPNARVRSYGGGRTIFLTEALAVVGWKDGDEVQVSVTDDNKIVIEKLTK